MNMHEPFRVPDLPATVYQGRKLNVYACNRHDTMLSIFLSIIGGYQFNYGPLNIGSNLVY